MQRLEMAVSRRYICSHSISATGLTCSISATGLTILLLKRFTMGKFEKVILAFIAGFLDTAVTLMWKGKKVIGSKAMRPGKSFSETQLVPHTKFAVAGIFISKMKKLLEISSGLIRNRQCGRIATLMYTITGLEFKNCWVFASNIAEQCLSLKGTEGHSIETKNR
jgi:hypothetical protein